MIYQRPTVGSLAKWADETGDSSYVSRHTNYDRFTISDIALELRQLSSILQEEPSVYTSWVGACIKCNH